MWLQQISNNSMAAINQLSWGNIAMVDWIELGLSKEARDFLLFAAICFDQIWFYRNKMIHEVISVDPICVSKEISRVYNMHKSAWEVSTSTWQHQVRQVRCENPFWYWLLWEGS